MKGSQLPTIIQELALELPSSCLLLNILDTVGDVDKTASSPGMSHLIGQAQLERAQNLNERELIQWKRGIWELEGVILSHPGEAVNLEGSILKVFLQEMRFELEF